MFAVRNGDWMCKKVELEKMGCRESMPRLLRTKELSRVAPIEEKIRATWPVLAVVPLALSLSGMVPVSAFCLPRGPVLLQMKVAPTIAMSRRLGGPRMEVIQIMQGQRVMKYDGFAQSETPSSKSPRAVKDFSCKVLRLPLNVAFMAGWQASVLPPGTQLTCTIVPNSISFRPASCLRVDLDKGDE